MIRCHSTILRFTDVIQGVFTYLIEKLGVKDVQFAELTTLDESELRSLGDIYGVIFLFKYPTGEKPTDVPKDGTFDHEAANNLFFAAQTIQNACGTQAIISVLLNKEGEVEIGKELKEFKEFAGEFPPEVRGAVYAPRNLWLIWNTAARRDTIKLRLDSRNTQLVRQVLAIHRRDTTYSDRGRRCLPLHCVRTWFESHAVYTDSPQIHIDKRQALRARRPPTRAHLSRPLHNPRIPLQDHPRPATAHGTIPRHRNPLQLYGLRARLATASERLWR